MRKKLSGKVESPIFVCGLARSGTTIVTQILNMHSDTGSFLYRDLPFIEVPYFWSRCSALFYGKGEKQKRLHGDEIKIHPDAPDAFEELLWKSHTKNYDKTDFGKILSEKDTNPELEKHLPINIQKVLYVRGNKERYLSKGNYNLLRINYIKKLFPDARFILCIRDPFQHAISLTRVHRKFTELGKENPRFSRQMEMLGHHEFGDGRKAIKCGTHYSKTIEHWKAEEDYEGYLLQWRDVYQFAYENHREDSSILWLDHDRFVTHSDKTLSRILKFSNLKPNRIKKEVALSQIKTHPPKETPTTRYDQSVQELYESILQNT